MTEYGTYELSKLERIWAIAIGSLTCAAAVWVIYGNWVLALLAAPVGLFYPKRYAQALCRKRKDKLRQQFKEALHALSSLLSAGRSVENAFASLEQDLALLLGHTKSDLMTELGIIANRLRNGEPLELPLQDFARRSDLAEARSFADVITICKKAGGDMVEVVRNTSQFIGEKLDVELEVTVLVAQKRFESRIMMAMPFLFVGMLGFVAGDYMRPLHQGFGWLLLTVVFAALLCCIRWMSRIMDIKL
ncbi:type II secretion system F family protein [Cohnella yongneupensis]|uniref:Type II secretion system F family protein n=1 Tax=Cohnella yongneupensis TaxID=425006 RepID=A0ABW0R4I6_9BACL